MIELSSKDAYRLMLKEYPDVLDAYSGQTARPFRRNGVPIPKQTA